MPSHVNEQIFIEDITEQEELAHNCLQVTNNFSERLQYQQAHPFLIERMEMAKNAFAWACHYLKEIRDYFPPMDGRPAD